jgi:hypothetical protein
MGRDNLTMKVRSKCPYCGYMNEVYVPKDRRQLKRIGKFLKNDMTWKGEFRCAVCMRNYRMTLLDDFFGLS